MNTTRFAMLVSSALLGAAVCACGGGGSGSVPSTPVPSGSPPAPILVNGATFQYTGTTSTTIVFSSPSPTQLNSSGATTFTDSVTVQAAPGGAPAPFDVQHVLKYTTTQQPAFGVQLLTQTTDDYENQTFNGGTEALILAGTKVATTGIDLSAGVKFGGGPFNQAATTTTTYVTPQTMGVYPLQTGAVLAEPLARTVSATTTDTNGGGTIGGGGPTSATYQNDGSFTRTATNAVNNAVTVQNESSNGTGLSTVTQTTGATTQSAIAPAAQISGTFGIPVTVTTSTGGATAFTAADWYAGGALAPVPLAATTRTVKGPIALPSQCAYSGTPPAIVEIDAASSTTDIFGSYAVNSTRDFDAAGISICRLQTSTTTDYTLTTGALSQTTTTTTTETLNSTNQALAGIKRSS
jgi:hypothetical protein